MSLTTTQSLPTDILVEVFSRLPASVVASTCRFVCKGWNTISRELALWQKIAYQSGVAAKSFTASAVAKPFTAKEIEEQVRNHLFLQRFKAAFPFNPDALLF